MGEPGRVRMVLAAAGHGGFTNVAALLRWRPLGVFGRWLVLGIGLFMGLGAVPLWALVFASSLQLGMDAGHSVGAGVGGLAKQRGSLRLGTGAAACHVRRAVWLAF